MALTLAQRECKRVGVREKRRRPPAATWPSPTHGGIQDSAFPAIGYNRNTRAHRHARTCSCVATTHTGLVASTFPAPATPATSRLPATPMSAVRALPGAPPPPLAACLCAWRWGRE